MAKGQLWTESELELLSRIWLSGAHHSVMAAVFRDRTPEAVKRAVTNHKHKWGARKRVLLRDLAAPIEGVPQVRPNDHGYVRAVLKAGGFPALRFTASTPLRSPREFWRAA